MLFLPKRYKLDNQSLVLNWDKQDILDATASLNDNTLIIHQEKDFASVAYLHNTEFVLTPTTEVDSDAFISASTTTFHLFLKKRRFSYKEQRLLQNGTSVGTSFSSGRVELRGFTLADAERFAGLMRHKLNTNIRVVQPDGQYEKIVGKRIYS